MRTKLLIAVVGCLLAAGAAQATERLFTYTYEPEVFPKGAMEFEQWVTLRTQRNAKVGEENYNRWEFREELEYGVTDKYTASLYLNTKSTSSKGNGSEFEFDGIALENRYMVLNPAAKPLGLTLYIEPRYSGTEAELEQRIIIGQRHGEWKWALNIVHETEWNLDDHETEGEFELDFAIARHLGKHWSLGIEVRNHNELPEYEEWENTAFYVGPVVGFRTENWWAALSVLPQVWGKNTAGGADPDGVSGLELEGHERLNIRLILGIGF